MRFGRFGRFPIKLGGGRPEAQRIYESMRDNRGEAYSRDDGGDDNKSLVCVAFAIARASSYQRRGANQAHVTLATDLLPRWERFLGVPRDIRDTDAERRGACAAVLAGNGPPEYDRIVAALRLAVGETVSIVAARAPARVSGGAVLGTLTLREIAGAGSRLRAGLHYVNVAYLLADGTVNTGGSSSITIAAGSAIAVDPVPLGGADQVQFFMSVSAGEGQSALVATNRGEAVRLYDYPSNPGTPGLHHLGILVSRAAWASAIKRARIHAVLGTMLPGHVTYDIVTSSPFLLGTSLLGEGAF